MIGFIVTMSQNKGGVQTLSPDEITYNGCTIVPSQLSCAFSSSDTQFWNISQKFRLYAICENIHTNTLNSTDTAYTNYQYGDKPRNKIT